MKLHSRYYDVAVIGGGIAGCAAAMQAARLGARTVLVEKTLFPGGLATTGLVNVYLPVCDGLGKQVSSGIAHELLVAGHKYGPGNIPAGWRSPREKRLSERFCATFSPASLVLALDELLVGAGVDIWLDTLFCRAENDGGSRMRAVEVENTSGRIRIEAGCFVDATGDADAVRSAGGSCFAGDNTLSQWSFLYDDACQENHAFADKLALHVLFDKQQTHYRGVCGKSVSEFTLNARKCLREHLLKKYEEGRERSGFFPLLLPGQANFRKTFAVAGRTVLSSENVTARFADSIGLYGNWRKPGPALELPFGSLVPERIAGVLVAGRCISAVGDAWELTRVIPVAAMSGQVCGAAAALAVDRKTTPCKLPQEELRRHLRGEGFLFHLDELSEAAAAPCRE